MCWTVPDFVTFISNAFSNWFIDIWKQDSNVTDRVFPVETTMESMTASWVSAVISIDVELSLMIIRSIHLPGFISNIPSWNIYKYNTIYIYVCVYYYIQIMYMYIQNHAFSRWMILHGFNTLSSTGLSKWRFITILL